MHWCHLPVKSGQLSVLPDLRVGGQMLFGFGCKVNCTGGCHSFVEAGNILTHDIKSVCVMYYYIRYVTHHSC